jgi:hypothetical protein
MERTELNQELEYAVESKFSALKAVCPPGPGDLDWQPDVGEVVCVCPRARLCVCLPSFQFSELAMLRRLPAPRQQWGTLCPMPRRQSCLASSRPSTPSAAKALAMLPCRTLCVTPGKVTVAPRTSQTRLTIVSMQAITYLRLYRRRQ